MSESLALLSMARSPIEQMVLKSALQHPNMPARFQHGAWRIQSGNVMMSLMCNQPVHGVRRCGSRWRYVADIVVGASHMSDFQRTFSIVVAELDGHDFHDRTREQAIRDRKRDRDMAYAGWRVVRFTGSEVYANPSMVWEEIVSQALAEVRRKYDAAF
jgi:very-short-patch-repair endonuclease